MGLSEFEAGLPGLVKGFVQRVPYSLAPYIEESFDDSGPAESEFSSSKRIGAQSGAASRSLIPGGPGNISRVDISGLNVRLLYGTRLHYLSVHEYGMFIPAKPQTDPTKRSRYKMEGYFWYKFRETGFVKYKIMAIAVRTNGGVTIPARPFWEKGLQSYFVRAYPFQLVALAKRMESLWTS